MGWAGRDARWTWAQSLSGGDWEDGAVITQRKDVGTEPSVSGQRPPAEETKGSLAGPRWLGTQRGTRTPGAGSAFLPALASRSLAPPDVFDFHYRSLGRGEGGTRPT